MPLRRGWGDGWSRFQLHRLCRGMYGAWSMASTGRVRTRCETWVVLSRGWSERQSPVSEPARVANIVSIPPAPLTNFGQQQFDRTDETYGLTGISGPSRVGTIAGVGRKGDMERHGCTRQRWIAETRLHGPPTGYRYAGANRTPGDWESCNSPGAGFMAASEPSWRGREYS